MESKSLIATIQWVEAKLGLKANSTSLLIWKDRIHERMTACHLQSYEEYEQKLQTSSPELEALVELIVNLETWFFRERGAFDYLTYFVKKNQKTTSNFRVLSLACSSGEEPYSIAMALFDSGLSADDFLIDALDIHRKALEKAHVGIYGKNSFRGDSLDFRDRYFDETELGYVIKKKVKDQVCFHKGNILEDEKIFGSQTYQVIFCRNLLIYLNPEAQVQLLNLLSHLLNPQGILVVGLAEGVIALSAGFEQVPLAGTNIFKINSEKMKEGRKGVLPEQKPFAFQQLKTIQEPLAAIELSLEDTSDKHHLHKEEVNKGYFEEWTQSFLEMEPADKPINTLSVLVFRLGKEWLALATIYCKEITRRRNVHTIPHRTGKILQGIVNLNGELELYVALHDLLQIETSIESHTSRLPYQRNRMMAIVKEGELWAFPVDEVDGIYKWNLLDIENVPVNVSKSSINYLKGMMRMENKNIGLLDEELLFASLKRSLQ